METTDIIKDLIAENRLEEAIELLNRRIEQNEKDDEAYYLLGNIFRKKGNWKQATFYYLSATEINPESPAKQAQEVLVDIQNFMNPDFNHNHKNELPHLKMRQPAFFLLLFIILSQRMIFYKSLYRFVRSQTKTGI